MGLPDETEAYAAAVAADWDEDDLPRAIYDHGDALDYGIADAIDRGLLVRYPHEIDGQANCYEQAVLCYSLADACDLDPRFFEVEEGEMLHGFVDVEDGDDRVVIDPFQNRYGAVAEYADSWMELEDGERKEFHAIEQKDEDAIAADIEDLRDSPAALLRDGQRLVKWYEDDGNIYDNIHFDPDQQRLERLIMKYTSHGPFNPLVRMQTDYQEDGQEERIVFSAARGIDWTDATQEHRLAVREDGDLELLDRDSEVADAIAASVNYEGGHEERMYSEEDHRETLEHMRAQIEDIRDDYTGFRGKSLVKTVESLEEDAEEDPEAFHRRADWFTHLRKHPEPTETVPDEAVDRYLDAHRQLLDRMTAADHHAGYERLQELIDPSEPSADPADPAARQRLAATDDPVALLAADPDLRERMGDDLPAFFGHYDREIEGLERPYEEIVKDWELGEQELIYSIELRDGDFATHDARLELTTSFEADGTIAGRTVSLMDRVHETDATYTLAEVEGGLDQDPDAMLDAVVARADEIAGTSAITAPEPTTDIPIVDQNSFSTAAYTLFRDADELPVFQDEDELEAFADQLRQEASTLMDSPYPRNGLREEAQEDIEFLEEIDGIDRTIALHMNDVLNQYFLGDDAEIDERVHDRFPAFEDRLREYAKRHTHFLYDEAQEDQELIERTEQLISDGLQERQTEDTGAEPLLEQEELAELLTEAA